MSLKICPFMTSGTVQLRSILTAEETQAGEKPGAKVTPVQCFGVECQLWTQTGEKPEDGDCSIALGPVIASQTLNASTGALGSLNNLLIAFVRAVKKIAGWNPLPEMTVTDPDQKTPPQA